MPIPRPLANVLLLAATMFVTACSSIFDGNGGSPLRRLWHTPLDHGNWSSLPTVAGGTVILPGRGTLFGLDAETGARRWSATIFTTGQSISAGNVSARNGRACVADLYGSGCVDPVTGHVIWTGPSDSANGSSDMDDSSLYFGTRRHTVVSRSVADGSVRWETDIAPNAPFLTRVFGVVVRGDTLYAATVRWLNNNGFQAVGDLIALDRTTGRELWRFTPSETSGFQGPPVLAGNLAIVNDVNAHALRAIDLSTHNQVWVTQVAPDGYITAETSPVVAGDTLFVGSTDTQLHVLDVNTGAYRWRVVTNAGSIGSTALCGRYVVVLPFVGGPPSVIDRETHTARIANVLVDNDLVIGRVAVDGTRIYAESYAGVYAFSCG